MGILASRGAQEVSWPRRKWRELKLQRSLERERRSIPKLEESVFGIRPHYHHRLNNSYFDDLAYNAAPDLAEAQREVYERALAEARSINARLVVDVGCGAGKKLYELFGDFKTVGFDVPETVKKLKVTYPNGDWRSAGFEEDVNLSPDVVICADVIEHIPNPDELVKFLVRLNAQTYFISTPERVCVYGRDHSGPPSNIAHCREWKLDELERYLSRNFHVTEHYISNERDCTQLAICKLGKTS